MKNKSSNGFKKIATASAITLTLIGSISFAIGVDPFKTASNVLGKSVNKIRSDEALGKTLSYQLIDAGKFDDFKSSLLKDVEFKLNEAVSNGKFNETFANDLYKEMSYRIPSWNGSGDIYGYK